ncbi:hypothetical protein INT48_003819 [Thamnidium elegans]|uniref:Uncharacterized protein n=1 Tax=Thamnidium elegans TaxID=101142 RepID=A0A8H7STU7_9FUNG|nr:hypothetical protein INT48_003819 [Thamnidium elegans]
MSGETINTSKRADKKSITVKSSVTGTEWKPEYAPVLKKLVSDVHALVTHTYIFSRYRFTQELGFEKRVQDGGKLSNKVTLYRAVIQKYKDSYLRHSSFTPKKLSNAYQIAAYEATKIQTAYHNAIIIQFGNKLRMAINEMVTLKERISHLTGDMKKKGCSVEEIKLAIKSDITGLVTQLKLAISSEDINQIPKDSIYYNAIANPILKDSKRSKLDKSSIWGKIVNRSNEALKVQGPDKSIKFRGIIITDGVGVSIVKQNFGTSKSNTSGPENNVVKEYFQYIEEIPKEEALATKGKAVLIDPGRRDLLYCMHEDKRFKRASIQECENKLSQCSSSTVNADAYVEYLKVRSQVSPLLEEYYGNEDMQKSKMFRYKGAYKEDTKFRLWNRDLAAVLNFRKNLISLRESARRPEKT